MCDEHLFLSPLQRELLVLFETGLSAVEVSDHSGMTISFLAEHLVAVRAALGVDSTAAAVQAAEVRGLL